MEISPGLPLGAHLLRRDHPEGWETQYVKSPAEVGTRKAKDKKAPLSEIIEVLNERFGTHFTEEDRLFFQQIKEKACNSEQVVQTALANPLDKFELGIRIHLCADRHRQEGTATRCLALHFATDSLGQCFKKTSLNKASLDAGDIVDQDDPCNQLNLFNY